MRPSRAAARGVRPVTVSQGADTLGLRANAGAPENARNASA
jgi:hypothetical protein